MYKHIALLFDFDSTLIKNETIDEMAKIAGKYDECWAITNKAMKGELEFSESLTTRIQYIKNLSANDTWIKLFSVLSLDDGVEDTIRTLLNCNYEICIISGGFIPVVRHYAGILHISKFYANELSVDKDGRFTGIISNQSIVDAEFKRNIAIKYKNVNYYVVAIGDGSNDLLMMEAADLSIAAPRAKEIVKANADYSIDNFGEIITVLKERNIYYQC